MIIIKKRYILYFILSLFLIFIIVYKNQSSNKITLGEVTHSIFYTPLYVAIENGYFKDEGLDIDLMVISGADKVSSAVLSNDVQIGFAGSESALYVYDKKTNDDYLTIFAGLTKRDGQFIISRNKNNNFSLKDLYGKEILVGRSTGMPALNFLNALKKNNIDSNKININYSVDFSMLSSTFISGTGDYVNLFEPTALALEKENYGYTVASVGLLSGEMPYTVFYAKNSFVKNNKKLIIKFNKAINKGLKYTKEHSSKEIANVIKNQFPSENLNDLEKIIEKYRNNDSWLDSTHISNDIYNNIENLLYDNKLISKHIDYKNIIVNY